MWRTRKMYLIWMTSSQLPCKVNTISINGSYFFFFIGGNTFFYTSKYQNSYLSCHFIRDSYIDSCLTTRRSWIQIHHLTGAFFCVELACPLHLYVTMFQNLRSSEKKLWHRQNFITSQPQETHAKELVHWPKLQGVKLISIFKQPVLFRLVFVYVETLTRTHILTPPLLLGLLFFQARVGGS